MFRQEVVEERSLRLHGDVILQQSLSTRVVTAIILVVVVGAVAWAVMGRYARIETARGMLVPIGGYAKIQALRAGVLTALSVKDGDQVQAGQKLVVVKMETPNEMGAIATQEELSSIANQVTLATKQIDLADQRSQSEATRLTGIIGGLRNQAATVNEQIGLQEKIVASMSQSFQQVAPVVDKGYISRIDYERRRQALLSAQEDLSRLRQQVQTTQADIARTEKERRQAVIAGQNDQANARSSLETLRQQRTKIEGEGSYAIEAPVSGRVTSVQIGVGRVVENSVPLMVIVPDDAPLRVDLFVPSRAIGFIQRGQEVRLLYDAFPYQRFGTFVAHVDTISRLAVSGPETGAPFEIKEPVYRVTATLDRQQISAYGERIRLQAGMTLVANIVLERQSFLDWMLDPIRAVSNRN